MSTLKLDFDDAGLKIRSDLSMDLSDECWRYDRLELGIETDPFLVSTNHFPRLLNLLEYLVSFKKPLTINTSSSLIMLATPLLQSKMTTICIHLDFINDQRKESYNTRIRPSNRIETFIALKEAEFNTKLIISPYSVPGRIREDLKSYHSLIAKLPEESYQISALPFCPILHDAANTRLDRPGEVISLAQPLLRQLKSIAQKCAAAKCANRTSQPIFQRDAA